MRSYVNVEPASKDAPTRPMVAAGQVQPVEGEDVFYTPADDGFHSIGRSALAHPVIVVVLALLGLVLGAGIGYEHPPTYTAEAQLIVGRTSGLAEQQVPGLALAVQGLASDYARLVTSSSVVDQTESLMHSSSLGGTLNASPVPNSSVIDVTGSAPSQAQALRLANAGATALTNVVVQATNDTQAQLDPIISSYKTADGAYEVAQAEVNLYQSQLNNLVGKLGTGTPNAFEAAREQALNHQISTWQTRADLAKAKANVYLNQYNAAVPPLAIQQEMVQKVGSATSSGSNRKAYTEAGGLAGAVGGLVLGLALASLIDTRRGRKAARYSAA